MRKKTALKDIAERIGVSTALVSYVLNNQEEEKRVGKEIALKIREVAKEMNYTTNQIAKSLKTRKTNTIGFVVADINYRFTTGVTRAIEAECQKFNYTVIFGSSHEDPVRFAEVVNVLVNRQVDGLILIPVEKCEEQIEYLKQYEIPFVLIDRILPNVDANLIAIDNVSAAFQATRHLIRTGHKRIGMVTYKTTLMHLQDRKKGYFDALEAAGIRPDENLVKEIPDHHNEQHLNTCLDELMKLLPKCDSVFFATDTLAVNGLRHINALKINVPKRLGIVSFDASEAFELFYCKITHGRQPLEEIGRLAVNTLLDVMKHKKTKRKIMLETDFHIGQSCGEK
ncbi:MAG: LacI family DNA-binding transcriptional regulator [Chitinophagaceae bacterium]|nr:LacI family DNA-binding transcriptional regulator [Chitinophagaceae bacterium]